MVAENNNIANNDNEEYDFGDHHRALPPPTLPPRTRPARRVPLITLNVDVNFVVTPTRPRLQRQNAMGFIANLLNVEQQAFMDLLAEVPDDDGEMKPPTMAFILTPTEAEEDWQCAICQEMETAGAVWHPSNCHTFHEECLQNSMVYDIRCPLCRGCVTPLLMRNICKFPNCINIFIKDF